MSGWLDKIQVDLNKVSKSMPEQKGKDILAALHGRKFSFANPNQPIPRVVSKILDYTHYYDYTKYFSTTSTLR